MHDNTKITTVSALNFKPQDLSGPGFKLALKPGWKLVHGLRPGDYVIRRTPGVCDSPNYQVFKCRGYLLLNDVCDNF